MTSGVSVGGPSVSLTRGSAPEPKEPPVPVPSWAPSKGDHVVTPINGERRVWKVAAIPGEGDLDPGDYLLRDWKGERVFMEHEIEPATNTDIMNDVLD